eukprot:5706657-Ditylum_brightwellii.AAC.1
MDRVDKGEHHMALGAAFCNITHLPDFSMLQSFASWNLSADELAAQLCGEIARRKKLVKWEFYSVVSEDRMPFVSPDKAINASLNTSKMDNKSHIPIYTSIAVNKVPQCMNYSMEESVLWHICKGNFKGCKYTSHTKYLALCSAPDYNIITHT